MVMLRWMSTYFLEGVPRTALWLSMKLGIDAEHSLEEHISLSF